jgi:hypothetical protein
MDLPAPVSPVSTEKPVRQVQLELAHDDEVAQGHAFEAHDPPSFQCSFLRSVS